MKFFILIFAACFAVLPLFTVRAAYAEGEGKTASTDLIIPSDYLEYRKLSFAEDFLYTDYLSVILERESFNSNLILYRNGRFIEFPVNGQRIMQVGKAGDDVIILDDVNVCSFDPATGEQTYLKDNEGRNITGIRFASNDRYLYTILQGAIRRYTVGSLSSSSPLLYENDDIKTDTGTLAANDKGDVFYVATNSEIHRINFADGIAPSVYDVGGAPVAMLADDDFLYFIDVSYNVRKINLVTNQITEIIRRSDSPRLGTVNNPKKLVFKGNNLAVIESNRIQEFTGNGEFTGFAITDTAIYPSRLTENVKDISLSEKQLLVLDGARLITYDNEEFTEKELDFVYNGVIAGGNGYLLFSRTKLSFNGEKEIQDNFNFVSGCYYNGKYFMLDKTIISGSDTASNYFGRIFVFSDSGEQIASYTLGDEVALDTASSALIASDVDGNFYIYRGSDGYVYKTGETFSTFTRVFHLDKTPLKLQTDLLGNVYAAFADGTVNRGSETEYSLDISENLPAANLLSFATCFNSDRAYFVFESEGYLLYSEELDLPSITKIEPPTDLKFTDTKAGDVTRLRFAEVIEGANVYVVDVKEESEEYFEYIKKIVSDSTSYIIAGETDDFYILAGELKGSVIKALVKKSDLIIADAGANKEAAVSTVYVSSTVNPYFYPILVKEDAYKLTGYQKLAKGTEISTLYKLHFGGKDFWYGTVQIGGETIECYVPVDFTISAPHENFITKEIENVGNNGANAVRNAVVITIVALSISVTSLFFIFRKRSY